MSLTHIRLTRLNQDARTAEYVVESPDFDNSRHWQAIGKLVLQKIDKRYRFEPALVWIEKKALPPEVYALDEAERTRLFESEYRGFGWGAWAAIIDAYASQFLSSETYPQKYPPDYF